MPRLSAAAPHTVHIMVIAVIVSTSLVSFLHHTKAAVPKTGHKTSSHECGTFFLRAHLRDVQRKRCCAPTGDTARKKRKEVLTMKKIVCALLAAVMVLSLAACGTKKDDNGGTTDVDLTA